MDANDINMVAVGLEQLGATDFVEGKFFDGGMYQNIRVGIVQVMCLLSFL